VIEPFRVSTEAIRASVASLPDAGRRDLATALLALSQLVAVQDALGEQFDESTVEVFGQGAVLLYRHAEPKLIQTLGWGAGPIGASRVQARLVRRLGSAGAAIAGWQEVESGSWRALLRGRSKPLSGRRSLARLMIWSR
jgi:hypothetical protein